MTRTSASVVVDRSPEDVFAFVADLRNEPQWHLDVVSVPPETDPVPVVGKTYPVTFKPFMGNSEGRFTAVEVVPGSKIVFDGEFGGLRPRITYLIEPAEAGTRFTRALDVKVNGLLLNLMTPVMALMIPGQNKKFVENLKQVLES